MMKFKKLVPSHDKMLKKLGIELTEEDLRKIIGDMIHEKDEFTLDDMAQLFYGHDYKELKFKKKMFVIQATKSINKTIKNEKIQ